MDQSVSQYLSRIGKRGGLAKNEHKARIARRNGRKHHKDSCECAPCLERKARKANESKD